nr:MAG TPA: hypothetical protein [Caudoviricetes sp.]
MIYGIRAISKTQTAVIIPPLFYTLNMNICTYIHTMQRILNYKP